MQIAFRGVKDHGDGELVDLAYSLYQFAPNGIFLPSLLHR
jgi:hypothetical protein